MTRQRANGLVQSVLDRLRNAARERGRPFAELLDLYAVERFLHRLGRSPHRERFVLKGALLVRHWLGADTRPTRDVDLLAPLELDADGLRELLGDLMRFEVEEYGIDFDVGSIVVRPIPAAGGRRGRGPPRPAHGDTPYTTVAEKLEAMVVLGEANSRTKDYYNLLEIPRPLAFDGPTLAESVRRTFARRATRIPAAPLEGLGDRFANEPLHATRWRAFLTKNQLEAIDVELRRVVVSIRRFAQPVLDAVREDQPFHRHWTPGGPWEEKKAER